MIYWLNSWLSVEIMKCVIILWPSQSSHENKENVKHTKKQKIGTLWHKIVFLEQSCKIKLKTKHLAAMYVHTCTLSKKQL